MEVSGVRGDENREVEAVGMGSGQSVFGNREGGAWLLLRNRL